MQKSCLSEKALTSKNRHEKDDSETASKLERYTIFHALFEAMRDKDNKHRKR
jgi:hypothetical protein